MKKMMYLIGLISAIGMSMGWTFKILHLSGGDELVTYGALGFSLLFLPMLLINYFKVHLNSALNEKAKVVFGFLSGMLMSLAITFKFMHLSGANTMWLTGALLFSFGYLPFLFFSMYKKSIS